MSRYDKKIVIVPDTFVVSAPLFVFGEGLIYLKSLRLMGTQMVISLIFTKAAVGESHSAN